MHLITNSYSPELNIKRVGSTTSPSGSVPVEVKVKKQLRDKNTRAYFAEAARRSRQRRRNELENEESRNLSLLSEIQTLKSKVEDLKYCLKISGKFGDCTQPFRVKQEKLENIILKREVIRQRKISNNLKYYLSALNDENSIEERRFYNFQQQNKTFLEAVSILRNSMLSSLWENITYNESVLSYLLNSNVYFRQLKSNLKTFRVDLVGIPIESIELLKGIRLFSIPNKVDKYLKKLKLYENERIDSNAYKVVDNDIYSGILLLESKKTLNKKCFVSLSKLSEGYLDSISFPTETQKSSKTAINMFVSTLICNTGKIDENEVRTSYIVKKGSVEGTSDLTVVLCCESVEGLFAQYGCNPCEIVDTISNKPDLLRRKAISKLESGVVLLLKISKMLKERNETF